MISDAVNASQFAAGLIVEELVRLGVRVFFVAPGSRSSPLVIAAAQHPMARCYVHYDERGTAFAALGFGRARRGPAAWVTTSGTAVANGLPAVIEAAADGVSLIALTADRPPELRKTGANQTIDQPGIFGSYVGWAFDVAPWSAGSDPCALLTAIDHAVHRAVADPGPVHLNVMFREPLAPAPDANFDTPRNAPLLGWLERSEPFTAYDGPRRRASRAVVEEVVSLIGSEAQGLVVAGRLSSEAEGAAVAALAERAGWPLLPDVLSFVRHSSDAVRHFDLLLATGPGRSLVRPRTVLHFGGRATSRRLYDHLSEFPPERLVLISPRAERIDPVHRVTHRIEADVQEFAEQVIRKLPAAPSRGDGSTSDIFHLHSAVAAALQNALRDDAGLTEPSVARFVAGSLPEAHQLFLGSSMPIRDVDSFAADGHRLPAHANRGASGIDGTIASAAGLAIGTGRPVTLLLGDLALLHDLNSLGLLRALDQPVVVIVVNNDGGGIFSFLPVADYPSVFEPYFGTPHGRSFESAAALFDLPYRLADSAQSLAGAYNEACASGASAIIEVRTERSANRRHHDDLLGAVRKAATLSFDRKRAARP